MSSVLSSTVNERLVWSLPRYTAFDRPVDLLELRNLVVTIIAASRTICHWLLRVIWVLLLHLLLLMFLSIVSDWYFTHQRVIVTVTSPWCRIISGLINDLALVYDLIVGMHYRFLWLSHLYQIFLLKLICIILVIHRLMWVSSDCCDALLLSVCVLGGWRDILRWLFNELGTCTSLALCRGSLPCGKLLRAGAFTLNTERLIFKVTSSRCLSL